MKLQTIPLFMLLLFSCTLSTNNDDMQAQKSIIEFGGDFSIMKKMEDAGGLYKIDGVVKEGFEIFGENGFKWARLRIFHTPTMVGPVCNDLAYTIASAKKAKKFGMKILLNFLYSDSWVDPGHQKTPAAWKDLSFNLLQDSVYNYTLNIVDAMDRAGVLPDMIQIGNEINNGLLWPHGKLWIEPEIAHWDELVKILKTAIRGVKESGNGSEIPIMIHAANGGDVNSSYNFYKNMVDRNLEFDVIGLSYYPWWHGTFIELESNILYLSTRFTQDFSIVETAYYSNDYYPEPEEWNLGAQPYPPTEQGQFNFMYELAKILKQHKRIKTIFYWEPDGLEIPKSKVNYIGRSLFDKDGDAFIGISAWKNIK